MGLQFCARNGSGMRSWRRSRDFSKSNFPRGGSTKSAFVRLSRYWRSAAESECGWSRAYPMATINLVDQHYLPLVTAEFQHDSDRPVQLQTQQSITTGSTFPDILLIWYISTFWWLLVVFHLSDSLYLRRYHSQLLPQIPTESEFPIYLCYIILYLCFFMIVYLTIG